MHPRRFPQLQRSSAPGGLVRVRRPVTPATIAVTVFAVLAVARMALPATVSGPGDVTTETATVRAVIDGDTFELNDGRRVRMLGIDAPEIASPDHPAEPGADDSAQWLHSQLESRSVNLQITGVDRYGRTLAWVYKADGTLVNLLSLSEGMSQLLDAFGLPTDLEPALRQASSEAQIRRQGIWKIRRVRERKNRT